MAQRLRDRDRCRGADSGGKLHSAGTAFRVEVRPANPLLQREAYMSGACDGLALSPPYTYRVLSTLCSVYEDCDSSEPNPFLSVSTLVLTESNGFTVRVRLRAHVVVARVTGCEGLD